MAAYEYMQKTGIANISTNTAGLLTFLLDIAAQKKYVGIMQHSVKLLDPLVEPVCDIGGVSLAVRH